LDGSYRSKQGERGGGISVHEIDQKMTGPKRLKKDDLSS